jgi:hypothetical protein
MQHGRFSLGLLQPFNCGNSIARGRLVLRRLGRGIRLLQREQPGDRQVARSERITWQALGNLLEQRNTGCEIFILQISEAQIAQLDEPQRCIARNRRFARRRHGCGRLSPEQPADDCQDHDGANSDPDVRVTSGRGH